MGRPRYTEQDTTALEKIEDAFWDILSEKPYESISVLELCRAAGVNKNTFYYHFSNIDDFACFTAKKLFDPRFMRTVIRAMKEETSFPDDLSEREFLKRTDRLCVLVGDGGSLEHRIQLHDEVAQMWAEEWGIDLEHLSLKDQLSLEFVLGGVVGVFAYRARRGNNFTLRDAWGADYLTCVHEVMDAVAERSPARSEKRTAE